MNRKYLYGLLFAPVLIFGIMAIAMPTFRTEFTHNVRSMLGFPPPQYGDGTKGLRSERPEEYGGGYASPEDDAEEGAEGGTEDAGEAGETETGTAEEATSDVVGEAEVKTEEEAETTATE